MADIGIMNSDEFNVENLTASINESPAVPGRLAALGLFDEDGIQSTSIQIEKDGDTLALVASRPRGAPGQVVVGNRRTMIAFPCVHLPQIGQILADEIQGVRAFGATTELQVMQDVVNRRLNKMRNQLDATHEWQRVGALKGQIIDADGTTVIIDILGQFGITQTVVEMKFATETDLRDPSLDVIAALEDNLGNVAYQGVRTFCGRAFWKKLITHESVRDTYLNTIQAAQLRGDPTEAFTFGGMTWERFQGRMNGVGFIDDNEALAVPQGVPDLLISRYGPADYMETVNTPGLPYYAKQEIMQFGKGVLLEAQSNPIHLPTRPKSIIRLVDTLDA
jgi:Phage major capsid protein E